MGYGGALIWTGLARNIKLNKSDKKIVFIYKISIKSLIISILKKKKIKNSDFVIYKNNSDIDEIISNIYYYLNYWKYKDYEKVFLYNPKYHYWYKDTKEKVFYKEGKHAIEIACDAHGMECKEVKPKIELTDNEIAKADKVLKELNLDKNYICIEPNIKVEFTPNKDWGFDNWQKLVDKLNNFIKENNLNIEIVQIGAPNTKLLNDVIHLNGKFFFRETARVLEKSLFFVSYEGGLVHLARAVSCKSIVLISALLPEKTIAYKDNINIYKKVDCSNCGLKTPCPYDLKCMKLISVDEVYKNILVLLRDLK